MFDICIEYLFGFLQVRYWRGPGWILGRSSPTCETPLNITCRRPDWLLRCTRLAQKYSGQISDKYCRQILNKCYLSGLFIWYWYRVFVWYLAALQCGRSSLSQRWGADLRSQCSVKVKKTLKALIKRSQELLETSNHPHLFTGRLPPGYWGVLTNTTHYIQEIW